MAKAQEILQHAYRTDGRPIVDEARPRSGGALHPLNLYRYLMVRNILIAQRGEKAVSEDSSDADQLDPKTEN